MFENELVENMKKLNTYANNIKETDLINKKMSEQLEILKAENRTIQDELNGLKEKNKLVDSVSKKDASTPTDIVNSSNKINIITNNIIKNKNDIKLVNKNRSKLLILGDDLGRGLNKIISQMSSNGNYQIESVIKPGATYKQVIENMDLLTRNYSSKDHIVILAGSNNFTKKNGYPRFRDISDQIKKCSSSNITIATVPVSKNSNQNKFITKFNNKLSHFVTKLNNYVPGTISLLNISKTLTTNQNKIDICSQIVEIINCNHVCKNLIFIDPHNNYIGNPGNMNTNNVSMECISLEDDATHCNENSRANFLYPRLSQLTLAT